MSTILVEGTSFLSCGIIGREERPHLKKVLKCCLISGTTPRNAVGGGLCSKEDWSGLVFHAGGGKLMLMLGMILFVLMLLIIKVDVDVDVDGSKIRVAILYCYVPRHDKTRSSRLVVLPC